MIRTVTLSVVLAACGVCGPSLGAQSPPANPDQQVLADFNQLMRCSLPAANVVFASQIDDPEERKNAGGGDHRG